MKRTGVIVPMDPNVTAEQAGICVSILEDRFPGVRFAVMAGARDSAVFEFDEPDSETPT